MSIDEVENNEDKLLIFAYMVYPLHRFGPYVNLQSLVTGKAVADYLKNESGGSAIGSLLKA